MFQLRVNACPVFFCPTVFSSFPRCVIISENVSKYKDFLSRRCRQASPPAFARPLATNPRRRRPPLNRKTVVWVGSPLKSRPSPRPAIGHIARYYCVNDGRAVVQQWYRERKKKGRNKNDLSFGHKSDEQVLETARASAGGERCQYTDVARNAHIDRETTLGGAPTPSTQHLSLSSFHWDVCLVLSFFGFVFVLSYPFINLPSVAFTPDGFEKQCAAGG